MLIMKVCVSLTAGLYHDIELDDTTNSQKLALFYKTWTNVANRHPLSVFFLQCLKKRGADCVYVHRVNILTNSTAKPYGVTAS